MKEIIRWKSCFQAFLPYIEEKWRCQVEKGLKEGKQYSHQYAHMTAENPWRIWCVDSALRPARDCHLIIGGIKSERVSSPKTIPTRSQKQTRCLNTALRETSFPSLLLILQHQDSWRSPHILRLLDEVRNHAANSIRRVFACWLILKICYPGMPSQEIRNQYCTEDRL